MGACGWSYIHLENQGSRGTLHKKAYIYIHCPLIFVIFILYFELTCFSYNLTPLVPEGTEHRLGGLHPGAPSLFPFRSRAGSPPALLLCLSSLLGYAGAVSLLTGDLVPQLALYLIKRNPQTEVQSNQHTAL